MVGRRWWWRSVGRRSIREIHRHGASGPLAHRERCAARVRVAAVAGALPSLLEGNAIVAREFRSMHIERERRDLGLVLIEWRLAAGGVGGEHYYRC